MVADCLRRHAQSVVFLSTSKRMLGRYLEIGHSEFLLNPLNFLNIAYIVRSKIKTAVGTTSLLKDLVRSSDNR